MSITERLMGVGSWSLNLSEDTPRAIMDQLDVRRAGFGHIVVTPTPVAVDLVPEAGILGMARYVGVYRKQPTEFGLSGAGLALWVADEDGKGPTYTGGLSTASGTFAQWVAALKPSSLASGITSAIGGAFAKTYPRTALRKPLDEVCAYFGAEWRVANDLKFDIGTPGALFNLVPNSVIVRREGEGGRDFNIHGIVGDLDIERDVEDWSRRVVYFTGTDQAPITAIADGGVAANDVIYRGPDGSAISMDRMIEDFSTTPTASGTSLAAAQYGRFKNPRQELTLSTGQYDIGQNVRVGDNVYVYDPSRGIQDLTVQVEYRGRTIYPETIRCMGLSWPVRRGMGVYFRYWKKLGSTWVVNWLDLTNYVEWESGETSVEVGAKPRSTN